MKDMRVFNSWTVKDTFFFKGSVITDKNQTKANKKKPNNFKYLYVE